MIHETTSEFVKHTACECRNMGAFYVGEKVYDCKPKEKTK